MSQDHNETPPHLTFNKMATINKEKISTGEDVEELEAFCPGVGK